AREYHSPPTRLDRRSGRGIREGRPRMASILIVDDEVFCRKPLAALLRFEGYEITEAGNGLEGLACLKAKRHDLILLDMLMPGVDGVTMLQALRRREEWA